MTNNIKIQKITNSKVTFLDYRNGLSQKTYSIDSLKGLAETGAKSTQDFANRVLSAIEEYEPQSPKRGELKND